MMAEMPIGEEEGYHDSMVDSHALQNEIKNLKCQLGYLRDWNAWLWKLSKIPNECLSATEKLVALDVHRQALHWRSRGLVGPQPSQTQVMALIFSDPQLGHFFRSPP